MPRLPVRNGRVIHWTEDEHRLFLQGLKLYKKNWAYIARKVVRTRTATQVASHYKKYKLHKKYTSVKQKKSRSILDITLKNDYQNISEHRSQQLLPQQPELERIQQFPQFIDRYYYNWVPTPNEELPHHDQQMFQELQQELKPPNNMSPYEMNGFNSII
ncbi:Transcription factor DIVARICATA, partial [Mucuna pruriens]